MTKLKTLKDLKPTPEILAKDTADKALRIVTTGLACKRISRKTLRTELWTVANNTAELVGKLYGQTAVKPAMRALIAEPGFKAALWLASSNEGAIA